MARAVDIPRNWNPRCGYPREQIKSHWPRMHMDGSELRSNRSGVVLSTTPFAQHPHPFWGTVHSTLSEELVRKRHNVQNPCFTPKKFSLTECSGLWVFFFNCGMGNIIVLLHSFLKGKQLTYLLPKSGDSGDGDSDTAHRF